MVDISSIHLNKLLNIFFLHMFHWLVIDLIFKKELQGEFSQVSYLMQFNILTFSIIIPCLESILHCFMVLVIKEFLYGMSLDMHIFRQ